MRRIVATATAAVAAASLAIAPAFADNGKANNNPRNDRAKVVRNIVQVNGTLAGVSANAVTVTVKTASMSDATRDIANQMLAAKSVQIAVNASTVVKRGTASGLASLVVGDRVSVRATCTNGPLACTAIHIGASPAPVVLPTFSARGVVVGNTGGTVTMVVTNANTSATNPIKGGSLLGTQFTVSTDTATAVAGGSATSVATIPNYAAVQVSGTCATTTPATCTAKRITVIVPTA